MKINRLLLIAVCVIAAEMLYAKSSIKSHEKARNKLSSKKNRVSHKAKALKYQKDIPQEPFMDMRPPEPYPDANPYAYVNMDPYVLQTQAKFKNAKIWPGRLPKRLNNFPYTGIWGSADVGIHNKNYYDGTLHLGSQANVHCGFYSTQPRSCVHKGGCGWCGETNKCIEASPLGPIAPCLRSTFLYNMPSPEWNPFKAPAINIHAVDKEGRSTLKVTHEPNLDLAYSNKPFILD